MVLKQTINRAFVAVSLVLALTVVRQASSQTPDAFNPNVGRDTIFQFPYTSCLAVQADGRVLVGGFFGSIGGQSRAYFSRVNADGTLDASFAPTPDTNVTCLAVQPDGKILVGGYFSSLGGQNRMGIGRLNCDGTVDPNFNPGAFNLNCMALQPDGKIVVGGNFSMLGGYERIRIGRLNADGTTDTSFDLGPSMAGSLYILCLAVQSDGKILVGGSFTALGWFTRNRIGRLNTNGYLDFTFNPGADGTVYALLQQPDGKILVGGAFTTLAGQPCSYLGRLNVDGTLDTSFNPAPNAAVRSLALQGDGKIIVGGDFASLGGQARSCIGRILADGTLDASFDPGANGTVKSIAVQADGKVVLGGHFTALGGQTRNCLGRLNNTSAATQSLVYDGANITWQRAGASPEIYFSMFEASTNRIDWYKLPEGQRISGGWACPGATLPSDPARVNVRARGFVAQNWFVETVSGPPIIIQQPASRTNSAGTTATFTVAPLGTPPFSFQWAKNGNALLDVANVSGAGTATLTLSNVSPADAALYSVTVSNTYGVATSATVSLSVLNPPTLDTLNLTPNGDAYCLAVQPDGKVLVGGTFTTVSAQSRAYLGRLNADGTLDAAFNPGANGWPFCFGVQADRRILVGGVFTTMGGQARNYFARLNSDGSVDPTFNPAPNAAVVSLTIQSDGNILLAGNFTTLAGQTSGHLGRLRSDGTLDSTFAAAANGSVYCLAPQSDGKILVGGWFSSLNGQTRSNVARLYPDGSLDTTFNPGANNAVYSLAIQADGQILVGGAFTSLGGATCNHLGRLSSNGTVDATFNPGAGDVYSLAVQSDGRILVGGNFLSLGGQSQRCAGRLNVDGTLDAFFNPGVNAPVYAMLLQADGKVLLGGSFNSLLGQTRKCLGRLNNTDSAFQDLKFDGFNIVWSRSGTSPEICSASFEASTDGTNWSSLGAGTRIAGGWQISGVSRPSGATIRARGSAAAGRYNGSGTSLEAQLAPPSPPVIMLVNRAIWTATNQFGFNVRALPGQAVVIEASTNLLNWIPLQTNSVTSLGLMPFTDARTGSFPRQFYRARLYTSNASAPSFLTRYQTEPGAEPLR